MRNWSGSQAFVLAISLLVGCSHVNRPLNSIDLPVHQRNPNDTRASLAAALRTPASPLQDVRIHGDHSTTTVPSDPNEDGFFVGVAISGGGSRSANYAAACMFELQRIGILQRVDYISSVSGGSLTAAFYCLSDDDQWNPHAAQKKLTQSFATDVIRQMLLPWNAIAQTFTSWDRTDLLASSFRKKLFSRNGKALTFADLRSDRPRLLINATDLQSGRRFVFCNESFDKLNSSLARYPIAQAVAASAAAPVLMHHVTLRDYSTIFKQYVHLIDGGVNDNLGIVTLIETYYAHVTGARQQHRKDPYPNGSIFIVLDARTEFDAHLSEKADTGFLAGLAAGAGLTSTVLLNRVSSATMSELIVKYAPDSSTAKTLRERIAELEKSGYLQVMDLNNKPIRIVHIALSRVDETTDAPFESFSERVNNIATYFNIEPTEAYNLYKAAELLMHSFEPQLQQIASDLKVEPERSAQPR